MKLLTITALILVIALTGQAQHFDQEEHIFIVEIDPLPFAMGGVGGHFGWSPKKSAHFSFGLSMIAGPEYPDFFININDKNRDQGWGVKINQGMGLWSHYYFREKNEGWFAGLQLFTQEMELSNENFPGETDKTNTVMVAAQGGYMWYPFPKTNLYLRPWAGFGYQDVVSGSFEPDEVDPDLELGDRTFHLNKFMPFATFHIGWAFGKRKG